MEKQVNKMFLIIAVEVDRRLGISSSEMLHPVTGGEKMQRPTAKH